MINLRFYQIKEILLQTSLFASKKTPYGGRILLV